MAATIIGKKAMPFGGDYSVDERRYRIVYLLRTENRLEGPLSLYIAPGMPQPFVTTYETDRERDLGAICQHLSVNQIGPTQWEVTAEYSTKLPTDATKQNPQDFNPDPLMRSVRWRFFPREKQKVLKADLDGRPFINSAWTPYGPEVATDDVPVGVLVIIRNEAAPSWWTWYNLANSVNLSDFWMAPQHTALAKYPTVEPKWENGVSYVEVQYEFWIDPDGWDREVDDFGPEYWTYDGGSWHKHYSSDSDGIASTQGVWLKPTGERWTEAEIAAGTATFGTKTFRIKRRTDFNAYLQL